ncbi:hydroxymethylbilane synthase [Lachnospiraceae bacterium]|nr:hydroxymethylbilane synthase [Lachnospiraceae bacterium]
MKKLRVGSRESKLAVIQSELVIDMIRKNCPDIEIELVALKTTGDKILDRTLDKVGGKGLFVKELDRALLDKEVDITVHSLKDVPMELSPGLPIIAYTKCEYPNDVLVLPKGVDTLDLSKPVGSSSLRRNLQFRKLFPEAEIKPVRGNVITRLEKLDRGEFGALILARAGLTRLGLQDRISRVFTADEIIPAAGQGVIAVQARAGEEFDFTKFIDDRESRIRAEAERAFVTELDGGCSSPIAAHAELHGDEITITGFYVNPDGEERIEKISGSVSEHMELGQKLARSIKC